MVSVLRAEICWRRTVSCAEGLSAGVVFEFAVCIVAVGATWVFAGQRAVVAPRECADASVLEKEGGAVLGMFEREGTTTDGVIWIYNRALVEIYDEQILKFHKKRQRYSKSTVDNGTSYLDFEGTLNKKENGREECAVHPESGLTQWGTCWGCYAEKQTARPSESCALCGGTGWRQVPGSATQR